MHPGENPLLGATEADDVLRLDVVVCTGDRLPEPRCPERLDVPEVQLVVGRAVLVCGELQQLQKRHRLDIRRPEKVTHAELVLREEGLDPKLR